MRVPRLGLAIGLSAVLLAAGLVVRAVATTIAGPLYVPDNTDAYAILGNATGNPGNIGVEGLSTNGNGVLGTSNSASRAGVVGTNTATGGTGVKGTSNNFGVLGTSSGIGVEGTSIGQDIGVDGEGGNSALSYGVVGNGLIGIRGTGTGNDANSIGVSGAITGAAGVALSATTEGNGALAMDAYSHLTGGYVMSLDQFGSMIVKGSVTTSGTPLVIVHGHGGTRAAYASANAAPAIEDTGEGQIVSGSGFVTIDPAFAATLDPRKPYEVLVTPEGDCRGLYVTAEGPRGFYVRELMSGRSSVAFAYRIAGSPASSSGAPRLPLYTDPLARRSARTH